MVLHSSLLSTQALDDLTTRSWCILESIFDNNTLNQIIQSFHYYKESGEFQNAAIGQGVHKKVVEEIRRGEILWLEKWDDPGISLLKATWDQLQQELNQSFLISLKRYEGQFSYYPFGGHYKKHIDQH